MRASFAATAVGNRQVVIVAASGAGFANRDAVIAGSLEIRVVALAGAQEVGRLQRVLVVAVENGLAVRVAVLFVLRVLPGAYCSTRPDASNELVL